MTKILTATVAGAKAVPITVESHVGTGLPSFHTVGLPDSSVKESHHRVNAALMSDGFKLPQLRTLVNLAPADVKKEGPGFDLAIALAVLAGHQLLSAEHCRRAMVVAELGLDGSLRPVAGAILFAELAKHLGMSALVMAPQSAAEAALVPGLLAYEAEHLKDVVAFMRGEQALTLAVPLRADEMSDAPRCFSEVAGREFEKWALTVAAIGGHHVLLEGSPGVGKTMLADRFVGLLPELSDAEQIEVLAIYSLFGPHLRPRKRPFRAPHHTLSQPALIGGGPLALPGEVSLAHRGVLFLDEFAEIRPDVINALRQPLESGHVAISRAQKRAEYPARFQLIAAANPCPCGNRGHPTRLCRCPPSAVARYLQRLRGPVVDRLDVVLQLQALSGEGASSSTTSAQLRARVTRARLRAAGRGQRVPNAELRSAELHEWAPLEAGARETLRRAGQVFALSERGMSRAWRVARSIADLAGVDIVTEEHIAQALSMRIEKLTLGTTQQEVHTN